MTLVRPIIIGLEGLVLNASEQLWLRELRPYGVILFSRNIRDREQVRTLTASIRDILGQDTAILVDQEGGRVMRLRPPEWPELPSALEITKLWRRHQFKGLEAANALGHIIGSSLADVGITHTCAPVVDLHFADADPVIGDRAFGSTPAEIIPLATAFLDGLSQSGVQGILKHIPGMGRARVDSHHALPVIDASPEILETSDWLPFQAISGCRWAMTAHVVVPAWDALPVTVSEQAISQIRERFGDPFLISDCLTMGAIAGGIPERIQSTLNAGVDLALFSNGSDDERRLAVESAGEPRLVRELSNVLRSLPQDQWTLRLTKLHQIQRPQTKTADPTRDQPSIS